MPITITQIASEVRRSLMGKMGEASFARMCMGFEKQLPVGLAISRYITVLQLMSADQVGNTFKVGVCWLDGNGYSSKDMKWLIQELTKVKMS